MTAVVAPAGPATFEFVSGSPEPWLYPLAVLSASVTDLPLRPAEAVVAEAVVAAEAVAEAAAEVVVVAVVATSLPG